MCEKCQDRGFTEQEHGLVMVLCDCDKAMEIAKTWREDDSSSGTGSDNISIGSADTSKPKRTYKHKAKKKARKGTG